MKTVYAFYGGVPECDARGRCGGAAVGQKLVVRREVETVYRIQLLWDPSRLCRHHSPQNGLYSDKPRDHFFLYLFD